MSWQNGILVYEDREYRVIEEKRLWLRDAGYLLSEEKRRELIGDMIKKKEIVAI